MNITLTLPTARNASTRMAQQDCKLPNLSLRTCSPYGGHFLERHPNDLSTPIMADANVRIVTFDQDEGKQIFWHFHRAPYGEALEALYPGVRFGIGPAIEQGFYYDVDLPGDMKLSSEDLPKIEAKMVELVKRDVPFQREDISWDDAANISRKRR